ncbi:mannose-1-phosphate guanylyltransferase/mannose-6-phosphate isomerase [Salipiger thiooxidans]|uniref:mannose-1-phosphate guanylyltransferase/mannose-6-phosphate isomerase n=1 Tax=Salipiger thiooxidans TaxID=282683 RepID=UPI001A9085BC|nr:mannose-1-phosphate guanylyltransferase/mannose-6-phosphate isomerase [Salipiger thiooxidans]MBN8189825.1 mannose-1-phosphate guanylyltransferase/mannose-6-phosphate isomerase [Salipiger thiooxidans]
MITPVLLCGGSGTRLWPLSRKSYPKQFVPLLGEKSLFQSTAERLAGPDYAAPMVLTNADFRFIVSQQLQEIAIDPGAILIEPEGRNTAPAILSAALWLERTNPDALMLVAPSDHVIPDTEAFRHTVAVGAEAARAGQLVTFGIQPTRPETGYGYLECTRKPDDGAAQPLKGFVEKPDEPRATEMLEAGTFLWNAGIFLFSVRSILDAFDAHAPDLKEPVDAAVAEAKHDLGFLRLAPGPWSQARDVSIDYAVMEAADNLTVVPLQASWSDLGGWDAVWHETGPDENGVAVSGGATAIECSNSLLRSESPQLEVVGIGLSNIMAVAMPDAVLVADMSRAQDVKKAVAALKAKSAAQATHFPKDHRPWGWFESLVTGSRFQVKRIHVAPGESLSLQSHYHRSEHWIIVEGTAKVTVDGEVRLMTENESIYVPLGTHHRLENPGRVPMVLIEVQTGTYLGEDDIVRHEDRYARDQDAGG